MENDSVECQILQLELNAALFLNIACYYQKTLNETNISELYMKKSTLANLEIQKLKKLRLDLNLPENLENS